MRFGIQLYTLRTLDESLPETIDRVGNTAFDGVEFAGFDGEPPDAVASALADAGLDVAGAHVGLDALANDRADALERYDAIGCDDLVVPSYDRTAFESASGAREAGTELATVAEELADAGADLHYHNHTFEFTQLDDGTAFTVFAGAADGVGLEVDTGLANHAGADPVDLLDRYGDRVSLVHLTDSRPESPDHRHADLGTGTVDLSACLDACAAANVDWVIFEHGLTDDPVASMEAAADAIAELR